MTQLFHFKAFFTQSESKSKNRTETLKVTGSCGKPFMISKKVVKKDETNEKILTHWCSLGCFRPIFWQALGYTTKCLKALGYTTTCPLQAM